MTGRHDATTPVSDTARADSGFPQPIGELGPYPQGLGAIPLLASHEGGPIRGEWRRPALVDAGDGITTPHEMTIRHDTRPSIRRLST
jgi:hypothetical protein